MNVLCALKLTELWNTSLLFDSNYNLNTLMGASLLALAKSKYYKGLNDSHIIKNQVKLRHPNIT